VGRAIKWAMALAATAATVALAATPAFAAGPVAGAARVGGVSPAQPLQLVFPLKADDAGLEAFSRAVSTPGSPLYARYESVPRLAARFGATPATRARVLAYLRAHGARDATIDPTGLLAEATFNAVAAERLFQTPLARFAARGARFVAPEANVTIPPSLSGLVNGVVGLNTDPVVTNAPLHLSHPPAARAASSPPSSILPTSGTPSGCPDGVGSLGFTPNQYLTAYDYSPLRTAHLAGQGERVALIEIDGFRFSDMRTYAKCFGLHVPSVTTYFGGVGHALAPGGETTLDLEILDGIVPDLDQVEVFEDKADTASLLRGVVQPFVTPNAKPQVISISLGICEQDALFVDGGASIRAAEREFSLMAATGITVLAASGDSGSAGCTNNQGQPQDSLAVSYPGSSPWVTSVGGTNLLLDGANQIQRQIVWNDANQDPGAAGGGGVSQLFKRPAYQKGTVAINRREVPDVSALADVAPGYATYCTARPECINANNANPWQTVGGTSASTPLLAAGIALVNQDLHRQGKQFVGQLNPLLYLLGRSSARTSIFNDVLQYGDDVGPFIPGNAQPLGCCTAGPGFDDASGWGSVDMTNFDHAAVQILPKIPNVSLSVPSGQRPVRSHKIVVAMACSASCRAAAFAIVSIGGGASFTIQSKTFKLGRNHRKSIPISFNAKQAGQLRTAIAKHRSIFAEAFGAILDGGGNVVKLTAGRRVPINQ
jgi:subtilase family serine protease